MDMYGSKMLFFGKGVPFPEVKHHNNLFDVTKPTPSIAIALEEKGTTDKNRVVQSVDQPHEKHKRKMQLLEPETDNDREIVLRHNDDEEVDSDSHQHNYNDENSTTNPEYPANADTRSNENYSYSGTSSSEDDDDDDSISEANDRIRRWHNRLSHTNQHQELQSPTSTRALGSRAELEMDQMEEQELEQQIQQEQEERVVPMLQLLLAPIAFIVIALVLVLACCLIWFITGLKKGLWVNISAWIGIVAGAVTILTCSGVIAYLLRQRRSVAQGFTEYERAKAFTAQALSILTTDYLLHFTGNTSVGVIDEEIDRIEQCLDLSDSCPMELLEKNNLDIDEVKKEFWTRLAYLYGLKHDQANYQRCIALISLHT